MIIHDDTAPEIRARVRAAQDRNDGRKAIGGDPPVEALYQEDGWYLLRTKPPVGEQWYASDTVAALGEKR